MTKSIFGLAGKTILGLALAVSLHASILFELDNTTLTAGDPTQLGRLSRDTIISDWSGPKAFPGVINTTTSYHYHAYVIPVLNAPFIQITVDDPLAAIFAAAYLNSYNPLSPAATYLGDPGGTGNFFGTDPTFFQVIVPAYNYLVLVVNDPAAANAGLGKPFSLIVEGFADTAFTDAPTVPEPAAGFLSAIGLGLAAFVGRYRSRRKSC